MGKVEVGFPFKVLSLERVEEVLAVGPEIWNDLRIKWQLPYSIFVMTDKGKIVDYPSICVGPGESILDKEIRVTRVFDSEGNLKEESFSIEWKDSVIGLEEATKAEMEMLEERRQMNKELIKT